MFFILLIQRRNYISSKCSTAKGNFCFCSYHRAKIYKSIDPKLSYAETKFKHYYNQRIHFSN
jgi:hypothetical protein